MGNPKRIHDVTSRQKLFVSLRSGQSVTRMRFTPSRIVVLLVTLGTVGLFPSRGLAADQHNQSKVLPVPVEQTDPDYPPSLKVAGIEGKVVVEFIVSDIGLVTSAHAHQSTHPGFEEAAVAAVKQWLFEPGMKNGTATAMRMRVPVIFTIPPDFISTTLLEIPPGNRPTEWTYDTMPRMQTTAKGVYPFGALLLNERPTIESVIVINTEGRISKVIWPQDTSEEFRGAVHALMDVLKLTPAKRDGKAVETGMRLRLEFNPYNGDVRIDDSAAAILKRLRIEGTQAHFESVDDLDTPLIASNKTTPAFPSWLSDDMRTGAALIEYYVDAEGRAQLPRIVSASDPAFGYAACQAVAQWQFNPPTKDGQPVIVKVRVPFEFTRE